MRLTVGQMIVQTLKAYGVPYVAGLPGHGNWSLLDAFADPKDGMPFVQVMHEQSAAHIADAHFRVTGQPIAACTSIGPGAMNAVMGLATAYADSTSFLLITGSVATHMRGHGVMQELDRFRSPDFPAVAAPVTKRSFDVIRPDEVPFVMHRAFNAMLSGRPGPVHMELPLDVQVMSDDIEIQDLARRMPVGRARASQESITQAAALLLTAERPCIVVGGGAISSDAAPEVTRLAELLNIPVVFTWNGKGAIAEDNRLCAGTAGWPGSTPGNKLAASADVVLSVGCKFTDWSSSSYRKGATFSFPPGKLIQLDIDPHEIGKNYPAAVGIVADCKSALQDLLAEISADHAKAARARRDDYVLNLDRAKADWEKVLARRREFDGSPMSMLRVLAELRKVLPRNGIVTVGSGHPQSSTKQAFPVYEPRTHITSGTYSSMGFAVPAAIGAKLAKPEAPVVCIIGDGDFMMSMQELAVCVMYNIPVVFLILNNRGYISIRDGQSGLMGRQIGSEFNHHTRNGEPYSVDFVGFAKSCGVEVALRVDEPGDLASALTRALACGGPALVEASITRDNSIAAAEVVGWWDFPVLQTAPAGVVDAYEHGLSEEQHRRPWVELDESRANTPSVPVVG